MVRQITVKDAHDKDTFYDKAKGAITGAGAVILDWAWEGNRKHTEGRDYTAGMGFDAQLLWDKESQAWLIVAILPHNRLGAIKGADE